MVGHAVKCCAPIVSTVRRLCILSNAVPLGFLVGDIWMCMLSNAGLLGLLLRRQLVVYAIKCCAPRVITGDIWMCMLSNAVLLGLLLRIQLDL